VAALLHLDAFPGIGQKKKSMAVNILYRHLHSLQPREDELRLIDVSYDMHVRCVFLRAGLADHDKLAEVIGAARTLNPSYPGKLDLGAWHVGRTWCHPTDPDCAACRLRPACARLVERRPSGA
jgi:endonuclease III